MPSHLNPHAHDTRIHHVYFRHFPKALDVHLEHLHQPDFIVEVASKVAEPPLVEERQARRLVARRPLRFAQKAHFSGNHVGDDAVRQGECQAQHPHDEERACVGESRHSREQF